jgi:Sulfotransferase family
MSTPRNRWPIVVGGCHRSGTSLVRRILNAHSRIFCGPEVKFFRDFYSDYKDDPIRHLRFFKTARAFLAEEELLDIFGKTFVALHERAASLAGKTRWADKNPENVLYLSQWQRLLGTEWLLIHVVRNPLDTLASMKEASFPLSLPETLEERIEFYQRYTKAGLEFGKANPDRYYRLIYEKLVSAPESVLPNLMTWSGEQFEAGQLDFNRDTETGHGLEDRKISGTAEIHKESVGRWPSILNKRETKRIREATEPLWSQIDPEGAVAVGERVQC